MQVFGFVVHWLAAGALVCFAPVHTGPHGRIAAGLAAIGRTSYATYLRHYWIGLYGLKAILGLPASGTDWTTYTFCYYGDTWRGVPAHAARRATISRAARSLGTCCGPSAPVGRGPVRPVQFLRKLLPGPDHA